MLQRLLTVLLLCGFASMSLADGVASRLFAENKNIVFQIRVVDLESGDKSSIGSGFQITTEGDIATNFHVVASYVHEPEKFRLEYIDSSGNVGALNLLAIDVIHDLAVARIDHPQPNFFRFNLNGLAKGDRIYSMGNPQDLGMTIIEGNFNGLIQTSRYQKILFSGSLSPGMSGGPAMDAEGRIIGVNVSKGSEQLSFLVPVKELQALLDKTNKLQQAEDFESTTTKQLLADQQSFYRGVLQVPWQQEQLGEYKVPVNISPSLKCWGHTIDEDGDEYKAVHQHCQSQDEIYISRRFFTGSFFYQYEWISSQQLNRFQFYSLLESRFSQQPLYNITRKEDATNYYCDDDFVNLDGRSWRVSTCMRAYKKYPGLYDMLLLMASVDQNDRSLLVKAGATGIDKMNALELQRKFMESILWAP